MASSVFNPVHCVNSAECTVRSRPRSITLEGTIPPRNTVEEQKDDQKSKRERGERPTGNRNETQTVISQGVFMRCGKLPEPDSNKR